MHFVFHPINLDFPELKAILNRFFLQPVITSQDPPLLKTRYLQLILQTRNIYYIIEVALVIWQNLPFTILYQFLFFLPHDYFPSSLPLDYAGF